jgi:hypothetical protein
VTTKDESPAGAEHDQERHATSSEIDVQALEHAINAQRGRMFQVLAIVQVVARYITQFSDAEADDPDCADALAAAANLLADVVDKLEPMQLGLGTTETAI